VTIFHHGRYGRGTGGAAIASVVHRHEIDIQGVVNRSQIIVIRNNFTVSVEKENYRHIALGQMKPAADFSIGGYGYRDIKTRAGR